MEKNMPVVAVMQQDAFNLFYSLSDLNKKVVQLRNY